MHCNERGTRNFDGGRQLDFKLIERQERLQKVLERRQAAITDARTSTPTTSGTSTTVTENTTTTSHSDSRGLPGYQETQETHEILTSQSQLMTI